MQLLEVKLSINRLVRPPLKKIGFRWTPRQWQCIERDFWAIERVKLINLLIHPLISYSNPSKKLFIGSQNGLCSNHAIQASRSRRRCNNQHYDTKQRRMYFIRQTKTMSHTVYVSLHMFAYYRFSEGCLYQQCVQWWTFRETSETHTVSNQRIPWDPWRTF